MVTLNVRPAGNAGVIAKVVDPLPPDDVTGIKDSISFPRVTVLLATACVVVNGEYTIVNEYCLLLVWPRLSVAVIV